MSKFIGTITDKSYYQEYSQKRGSKTYRYRICSTCNKKLDEGYSDLDGGNRVGVLPHICREFREVAEILGTNAIPKPEFEWGQFIFKSYMGIVK